MNNRKTLKKIKELFALRRIPELLKLSGIKKNGAFVKKLYHLQTCIYRLDDYLESNWRLQKAEANKYWKEIYAALKDLGYTKKQAVKLCADIQRYQDFEWSLRTAKPSNRKQLYSTYRIKSCDVTLMRKLIYMESQKGKNAISLGDWGYYDIITEVNDDIEDLAEDCKIYNGNRFLISILQNGKQKTLKAYLGFIKDINKKATLRFAKDRKNPVKNWLKVQSKETKKLLFSQLNKNSMRSLKQSKLAKKMYT